MGWRSLRPVALAPPRAACRSRRLDAAPRVGGRGRSGLRLHLLLLPGDRRDTVAPAAARADPTPPAARRLDVGARPEQRTHLLLLPGDGRDAVAAPFSVSRRLYNDEVSGECDAERWIPHPFDDGNDERAHVLAISR